MSKKYKFKKNFIESDEKIIKGNSESFTPRERNGEGEIFWSKGENFVDGKMCRSRITMKISRYGDDK